MKSDKDLGRLDAISAVAAAAAEDDALVSVSAVGGSDLRCGWADRDRRW